MVRCESFGGLNNAAHLKEPSVLVHHRSAEDRIAHGFLSTKRNSPWRALLDEVYASCADLKI